MTTIVGLADNYGGRHNVIMAADSRFTEDNYYTAANTSKIIELPDSNTIIGVAGNWRIGTLLLQGFEVAKENIGNLQMIAYDIEQYLTDFCGYFENENENNKEELRDFEFLIAHKGLLAHVDCQFSCVECNFRAIGSGSDFAHGAFQYHKRLYADYPNLGTMGKNQLLETILEAVSSCDVHTGPPYVFKNCSERRE